ncbi:MarR family winged helix-turn-helix transcriptional regulator [Paenibacillus pinistramenti]|uniref:MarR family winged helix-turn-helix transcriptional regulator n=1 Tax=Paenibacillus pinistramenti TaxID=1768003 RepID=UPI0011096F79|nr:MarR family transcriptional regulator [Paenibacillus pinistramenti]
MEPNENNMGYLLNKAALLLKWDLNKKLNEYELTATQWAVLRDLHNQEMLPEEARTITPAHVAERLLADRPTISGVIDRLSKKGLLRIERNPADRRSQLLFLTPEAGSIFPRLVQDTDITLEQALQGLSAEQIKQAKEVLLTMIRNLES